MRRGGPIRRSRLNAVSPKRRAEKDAYAEAVDIAFRRDRWTCQAIGLLPGHACQGRLDAHHLHPVGKGGPRTDPANIKVVCRAAHHEIHNGNPRLARIVGLLI